MSEASRGTQGKERTRRSVRGGRLLGATAAALLVGLASGAAATPIRVIGSYQEQGWGVATDLLEVTNDPVSGARILRVVIDLTGSAGSAVFDPPFQNTSSDATGFSGSFSLDPTRRILTLDFTDFDPGETFRFTVDVDPGLVVGAEFAGATLTATFEGISPASFAGNYTDAGGNRAEVVVSGVAAPEPGAASLLGLGLALLGGVARWRNRAG